MRIFWKTCWSVTLALSCALSAGFVHAGEGRRLIAEPTTISEPGTYVVTRDIAVTSGDVITVQASPVTIDLNGKSLSLSGSVGTAIRFRTSASTAAQPFLLVADGRLSGGLSAVRTEGDGDATVTLRGLEIESTSQDAIALRAGKVVLLDNRISRPGIDGIDVTKPTSSADLSGVIANNVIQAPGAAGIFVTDGDGLRIEGNVIRAAGNDGIWCRFSQGARITGNAIEGSGDAGIEFTGSLAIINDNTVVNSGSSGISIGSSSRGNLIRGNVAARSTGDGLVISSDRNLIDRNQLTDNQGYGLKFTSLALDNAYRGNMLRGNTQGSFFDEGDNRDEGDNLCAPNENCL